MRRYITLIGFSIGVFIFQTQAKADPLSWGNERVAAQNAWRITKGSREMVVAVIDTGVDLTHPALTHNLWVNSGETGMDSKGRPRDTNGVDDDKNGFVDDVHGWNFAENNNDLWDSHGHGTHIAGIIAAKPVKDETVTGIAPNVKIMVLRYYSPRAAFGDNIENTSRAIDYAIKMGARIINYSSGGTTPNDRERAAVARAADAGVLFVAAAGNEKSNSDQEPYYPADYDLPNILSVTAIDRGDKVLPSSNYGVRSVDLAAPGKDIYSTLPRGRYGFMTGTSQATAFASGVAALLMSLKPDLKEPDRVVRYLVMTGDKSPGLQGKTRYSARLNSYRALAMEDVGVTLFGYRARNAAAIDPRVFTIDYYLNGSAK